MPLLLLFQHTAARRRLAQYRHEYGQPGIVSTHSRPKAAGAVGHGADFVRCFNTQPPEGGWGQKQASRPAITSFNTQPPEGGWHG